MAAISAPTRCSSEWDGWLTSTEMSATKPPIPCRSDTESYGARKASLISGSRPPRLIVTRRNQSVTTVAVGSMGPASVARRGAGIGGSSGWWTAVFRLIEAETRSVLRAAHPRDRTPPQSWPIVTIGSSRRTRLRRGVRHCRPPRREGGDTTESKSSMRWDMRRTSAPWRGRKRLMAQPLGEAHVELVGGDEAPHASPGSCCVHARLGQMAPQVRPGRVAVEGEDRAGRFEPFGAQHLEGVENVEGMRPILGDCLDDSGPGGVPLRAASGESEPAVQEISLNLYHSISVIAVLSPDPTPMHRMRSPGLRLDASRLSVIGRDAGPTLPSSG